MNYTLPEINVCPETRALENEIPIVNPFIFKGKHVYVKGGRVAGVGSTTTRKIPVALPTSASYDTWCERKRPCLVLKAD